MVRDIRDRADDLRRMLNEWDFIGVHDQVDDEYDCLIGPLLSRLARDAAADEIAAFLRSEITDHFGMSPAAVDIPGFAGRLVAWWRDSPRTP